MAASRATTFAALVPAPQNRDELRKKLEFVAELSKWENSQNPRLMETARKEIRDSFEGKAPKVLDCFAGGGAIPLEALRLGCEAHALELNPVAIIILKAVLEYPQKFQKKRISTTGLSFKGNFSTLTEDVKKWGNWVLGEAEEEMGKFYPPDPDGSIPVGHIWARTIRCQNPSCNVEIPLMRQLWLARKENRKIALKIMPDKENKQVNFRVVSGKEIDFDPSQGTTKKATVLCPICGAGMDDKVVRKEAREGRMNQRLVALVLYNLKEKRKLYRIANKRDKEVFEQAEKYLKNKIENWKWDFNPTPDEALPKERVKGFSGFRVLLYGISNWGDLFNSRQKLALITFIEKVRLAYEKMLAEGVVGEYAKTMATYLALVVSRASDFETNLCRWHPQWEFIPNTFARQALPMSWDYAELNLFSPILTGTFESMLRQITRVLNEVTKTNDSPAIVTQSSATSLHYPDDFFNAVITDPPYYDNIAYGDLSDFFYVFLKRTIGDLYPEIFATPLTPKSLEIIQDPARGKDATFFENMLTKALHEIHRVLKPEGIAIIVFAYKSTEAWETVINSLVKAGLILTASWPIHTEMKARLVAQETAALASSVYMVCRKRSGAKTAYFNEIRDEIESRIKEKLTQF